MDNPILQSLQPAFCPHSSRVQPPSHRRAPLLITLCAATRGHGLFAGGGAGGGFEGGDFSDFFSSIFGARGGSPFGGARQQRSAGRRGQDVELELAVFLEETLSKESKQISFQVPQTNAAGQRTGFTTKTLNVKIPAGVTGWKVRSLPGHKVATVFTNTVDGKEHPRFMVMFPGETSFTFDLTGGRAVY